MGMFEMSALRMAEDIGIYDFVVSERLLMMMPFH
jgi:hypothetical protein